MVSERRLRKIDAQLESNIEHIWHTAARLYRGLGYVSLTLDRTAYFQPGLFSFYGSYVGIVGPKYAEQYYLGMPRAEQRFSPFHKAGIPCSNVSERSNIIIAHELGHAHALFEEVERSASEGDDYLGASEKYGSNYSVEINSLPLKMGSTEAGNRWRTNQDGYRDKWMREGVTSEQWQQMLSENTAAFLQLPSEATADAFAIDLLMRVPQLIRR
jgi:hypothetical protein